MTYEDFVKENFGKELLNILVLHFFGDGVRRKEVAWYGKDQPRYSGKN
jgi:hypothetical protein